MKAWARSLTVRHVAAASFTIVAAVAAVISYSHVRHVAGENWQASLLPLSIDGLLIAGSLALWLERRDGGRGSWLSWTSVVLGVAASLGANLAASNPTWISREVLDPAVAAWPALALALAFELLVRVRRSATLVVAPVQASGSRPEPVTDRSADPEPHPVAAAEPVAAAPTRPLSFADAVAWAAREGAGAKRIQAHAGLSEHHSKRAAAAAKAARGPRAVAG